MPSEMMRPLLEQSQPALGTGSISGMLMSKNVQEDELDGQRIASRDEQPSSSFTVPLSSAE